LPARTDRVRPRHRERLVFRSQVALGAVGIAATTAAVVTAADSVHRAARGTHELVIAGQQLTYPAVNIAAGMLLALAALGAVVLATIVRGAWSQLQAYRSFLRAIPVLGPLPGHPGVTVIDEASPQAFCAGYLRPRVYISQGALELLAEAELAAVLSHEDRHRSTRDPLRFACGRVLSQALFFLPALRPLGDRYEELAEQKADEAAVRASAGARGPLAAALLAFDAAAPAGAAGISNERVDSLLGEPPRWRLPSPLVAVSLAILGGLVVLVWRTSAAASAHATFNLPVLSSQPCMLVLALLPAAVILAGHAWHRRLARPPRQRLAVAGT
jgi:Zn-dependent protease with chaperone function